MTLTAHDILDLGYDELQTHGCDIETALAASDCRAEIALAYLHAIWSETGDADRMVAGVWRIAQTISLINTRGYMA